MSMKEMFQNYSEMLSKMTTEELRAEKKNVGIKVASVLREYYGCIANAPSWDAEEHEINCMKQSAIIREGKRRIAEGRI